MIKERKFNFNFFVKKKNNSVSTAMKKLKKDKLILMILMKYQKDWKKEMKKLWRKNTDLKSARVCQIDFIKRCQKELENITDGVLCDFFRIMTKTQHLPPKNLIIFLMKIFASLSQENLVAEKQKLSCIFSENPWFTLIKFIFIPQIFIRKKSKFFKN